MNDRFGRRVTWPTTDEDAAANARLRALNAELLAALERLVAASDQFVRDTGLKHGDLITDAADNARSIIARAKGE